MNLKVLMIIRIIFALFLLFFGLNKIFGFVDPPPPPKEAMNYWAALMATKTMTLVAIVEVAAGLSLLVNKYAAFMMIILMSVSINAVLYHLSLDSASIIMALVLFTLNIFMLYAYRNNYKGLLR
jgi:putative oxidoreductase